MTGSYQMPSYPMNDYAQMEYEKDDQPYSTSKKKRGYEAPKGSDIEVSGPLDTPPPHRGLIRLRLPVTWADVSIDGVPIDRMGQRRSYVTPELKEPRTFDVKATWNHNGRTTRIQDKVTLDAGQIRTLDFTSGK